MTLTPDAPTAHRFARHVTGGRLVVRDQARTANSRVLTAAAQKLPARDPDNAQQRTGGMPWQNEAWNYYDLIGEIKHVGRFYGNSLSRLRLYAAVDDGHGDRPSTVTDAAQPTEDGDGNVVPARIPTDLADAAVEELARLKGDVGGQSQLLSSLGINLAIPGECYLVGIPARDAVPAAPDGTGGRDATGEQWNVYSVDELIRRENVWQVRTNPAAPGTPLPDDALVVRFWQQHPRWSAQADSSIRGVTTVCEELVLLSQEMRAAAKSRLSNGILLVPTEITFGPADETTDDDTGTDDPFLQALLTTMVTAIQDPGSAAAVVPNIIRGPSEALKEFRHVKIDRPFSKDAAEQRKELIQRLAQGVDLPVEIVLGHQQTTYANAEQVDRDRFTHYLEPTAVLIVSALTVFFLRPALLDRGFDTKLVDRIVVHYDDTELVAQPNLADEVDKAYEMGLLTDEAYARIKGFAEGDLPDQEQQLLHAWLANARRGRIDPAVQEAIAKHFYPELEIAQAPAAEGNATTASVAGPPVLLTAAAGRDLGRLSERLNRIDQRLAERVHAAADAAMRAALSRAGNKVARKAQSNTAARAAAAGVDRGRVAATLGRALVADGLGLTDDELLEGEFDDLGDRFDEWTGDAQTAAVAAVAGALAVDPAALSGQVASQQQEDRQAGRDLLVANLTALARTRLYHPDTGADAQGEYDPSMTVPFGMVRGPLAVAGGANRDGAGVDETGRPVDGARPVTAVAAGTLVLGLLRTAGVTVAVWTWRHGAPLHPFEPHEQLDGEQFTDPSGDDRLAAPAGVWTGLPEFFPSDHAGCTCSWDIALEWVADAVEAA